MQKAYGCRQIKSRAAIKKPVRGVSVEEENCGSSFSGFGSADSVFVGMVRL
jgi:hypothetical protein